jgi:hypothetical protein
MAQKPNSGQGCLIADVSRAHTIKHTWGERGISVRHSSLYLHDTPRTKIYVLSGIRIREPCNQAAADLSLGTHGRRERLAKCRQLYIYNTGHRSSV